MDELYKPPGIDMGKYVFGEPLPGPRVDPYSPPVVPAAPAPAADAPNPILQMLKGLLPMGGDWNFGAAPAGETDLRHDGDPQTRERAEQQAADADKAAKAGVTWPTMPIFDGLF